MAQLRKGLAAVARSLDFISRVAGTLLKGFKEESGVTN